jgi:hypothetical protein
VEANSTGGQGSRRAVAPSEDDDITVLQFWNTAASKHPAERENGRYCKQKGQCMYNVTLRRVRESLLPWKSNNYYLLVCVCVHVALLIQHATRMRHLVTSFVDPSFSTIFFEIIS